MFKGDKLQNHGLKILFISICIHAGSQMNRLTNQKVGQQPGFQQVQWLSGGAFTQHATDLGFSLAISSIICCHVGYIFLGD